MRISSLALLVAVSGLCSPVSATELPAYTPDANVPRSAIPEGTKWNLSVLFPSDEAFEKGRIALLAEIPALASFQGKLADPSSLVACLDRYFLLHGEANRLTLYANMRQSTGQSDDVAAAMGQRSLAAMDELMGAAAFLRREVMTLPGDTLAIAFTKQTKLESYRGYIENLRRRTSRLLSPDAEKALSLLGDNLWAEIDLNELPSGYEETRSALLADIVWPKIKDASGKEVQLTLSNYGRLRASTNPDVRRAAVTGLFATVRQNQHALAATMAGQLRLSVAYARARGYDSALAAYLDKDEVNTAVYDTLVNTVGAHTPLLHRYIALRKKLLKLDQVHLYDLYNPLVASSEKDYPIAEAVRLIPEALKPLGADYQKVLLEGLDPKNGWLDLYPHKDKQRGAFSSSIYGAHPFVFMNYQNGFSDMSTLAHEYGHALHSYLAMKAQSYPNYRYTPFLAEIASTCNEALLSQYLLAHTQVKAERAALLVARLESIRTTIFRQTMFAEFERTMHQLQESGTPITASLLEGKYRDLLKKYYGPDYTIGADDGLEWAIVPHFYYKYYVYVYATGLASGISIAERVQHGGAPAAEAYLGMLKGGCSKAPLELLKGAGVDLTSPAPIETALRSFEGTLNETEKLLSN